MNGGSNALWVELSTMADGFANLGRRLLSASRLLHAPGVLPSESLVDELTDLRTGFATLRERVTSLAVSLGVSVVEPNELNDLKALAVLLEAVEDAEERRDAWSAKVTQALTVLDGILELRHAQNAEFAPLIACQEQARTLRWEISFAREGTLADTVQSLVEMDHPFAYVLTMVRGADGVDDDLWETLFESVGSTFSRPLAAAVTRGRIIAGVSFAQALTLEPTSPVAPEIRDETAPTLSEISEPWFALSVPSLLVETPRSASRLIETSTLSDDVLASFAEDTVPWLPHGIGSFLTSRRIARVTRRKTLPLVERLETVRLLTCNTISGFVFLDSQNDGIYQPALDKAIAGNTIELLNSSGVVVAKATSDANGAYAFSTDSTIDTASLTLTKSYSVPDQLTNIASTLNINRFDTSLGTLTQVDIRYDGTLVGQMKVENTSQTSTQTISGNISGTFKLVGQGVSLSTSVTSGFGPFNASAYDGTLDYSGTSGIDFGAKTSLTSQSHSLKTSAGADLTAYQGTGTLPFNLTVNASSPASGGGNVIYNARTSASANVTVVYHYNPSNCLAPGNYTILQPDEPTGTLNGKDSINGAVLPPTPSGKPDSIPVTLKNVDATNNDFGEIKPAEIKGFVYQDVDLSKLRSRGDIGIPNIQVLLQGTDDLGDTVSQLEVTDGNGAYDFPNLRPGTYSTALPTNPAGYINWFDTKGNIVPIPGSDQTNLIPGITIAPGDVAAENNFGEIKGGTPQGCSAMPSSIESVKRLGIHHQPTKFVLTFSAPLDPATATNIANYQLLIAFRDGKFSKHPLQFKSAIYDPTNNTVTLLPAGHLNIHFHYQLTVSGLKDPCGDPFVAGANGKYVSIITKQDYQHPVPAGPNAHVAKATNWVVKYPRLASNHGHAGHH